MTYDDSQGTRPGRGVASVIQVREVVGAEGVDHELGHVARDALGAADVLQAKDDLQNFGDRLLSEVYAGAAVEASTLDLVPVLGAPGIDLERVGEVIGLKKQTVRTIAWKS